MEKRDVKKLIFQAYNLRSMDGKVRSTESLNEWFDEIYSPRDKGELLDTLIEIDNYINKIEYKSMAMMVIRNKAKTAIKKYSDESKDA